MRKSEVKKRFKVTKWGLVKQAMKAGMLFFVVFAAIQGYKIWVYFKRFPAREFIVQRGMSLPAEYTIKAQMLQTGKSFVLWALFFFVLFEIAAFMENREGHWAYLFVKRMKPVSEKVSNFFEDD